jgi:hypothetical protein
MLQMISEACWMMLDACLSSIPWNSSPMCDVNMLPAPATLIPFGYVSHHPKFVSYVAIQAIQAIYI